MRILLKEWWWFLNHPFRYSCFWEDLTEDMEADLDRSPWGMMASAKLAYRYDSRYKGLKIRDIYSLFCDEEKLNDFILSCGNWNQ